MQEIVQASKLTDAEILRAPANDYMNDVQLAFFRARLNAMRKELQLNRELTAVNLRSEVYEADPSDRATREEERTLELSTRDRERQLAIKIEQALARIDERTYGYCTESGEPIGIPRLLARPTAELTIEAQQRREHRRSMGME